MLIEAIDDIRIKYSYATHHYPEITKHANHVLHPTGILSFHKTTNFCYLKVSNEYIYDCFSLLKKRIPKTRINMPDYFIEEKSNIGAHISLVYHQEINSDLVKKYIESCDLSNTISFCVHDIVSVNVFDQTLFTLLVSCSRLDEIRKRFNLPKKLSYHGLLVPFHITIAVSKDKFGD